MKCNKCGFESEQDFVFCSACGEEQKKEPEINVAAQKIFPALKDNLFLAICILLTVSAGCILLGGNGIPVIEGLLAIFMWIVREKAQKGIVDVENMRHISGTVYANYVVTNVVCIIGLVSTILGGVCLLTVGAIAFEEIRENLSKIPSEFVPIVSMNFNFALLWIIIIVLAVICSVMLIMNVIGYRKIHVLAKSTYMSVQNNDLRFLENVGSAKTWLWVFGIMSCVGALGSAGDFLAFAGAGCLAVSTILAAVLVGKYTGK